MQKGLIQLNYDNKTIGQAIDTFWLQGPLMISVKEQAQLLSQLTHQQLAFNKKHQQAVKSIILLNENSL